MLLPVIRLTRSTLLLGIDSLGVAYSRRVNSLGVCSYRESNQNFQTHLLSVNLKNLTPREEHTPRELTCREYAPPGELTPREEHTPGIDSPGGAYSRESRLPGRSILPGIRLPGRSILAGSMLLPGISLRPLVFLKGTIQQKS